MMSDFHFVHPALLSLAWLILALALVAAWAFARRARQLRRFADDAVIDRIAPGSSRFRPVMKAGLAIGALIALVFAGMDPRWGVRYEEIQRRGMDVFFVVDVSRSMLAEDAGPNRLERAKQAIADAVDELAGDRAGIISFAGDSQIESPLTLNYRSLKLALDDVDARNSSRGGSMLGDAIRLAASSFTSEEAGGKAIVILSDGEDQQSMPVEMAESALAEQGIRVYTVGIGDDAEGARIPILVNGRRSWLTHDGQQVWTKMEPSTLEATALAGEGAFIPAGTKQFDLGRIFNEVVAADQRADLESTEIRITTPRFQWLAGLALILLLADILVPTRRRATTSEEVASGGAA
jgi:Ca-activated chloride channel family protein